MARAALIPVYAESEFVAGRGVELGGRGNGLDSCNDFGQMREVR